jgi:uncharacterized protein with HEPN domain
LTLRDPLVFLEDIVDAARLILRYVDGVTFEEFEGDIEKQDSVVHRIEVIGEAARHLPQVITDAIPDVPWPRVRGMRHLIAHQYWDIDLKQVWSVIEEDLRPLITAIEAYRT